MKKCHTKRSTMRKCCIYRISLLILMLTLSLATIHPVIDEKIGIGSRRAFAFHNPEAVVDDPQVERIDVPETVVTPEISIPDVDVELEPTPEVVKPVIIDLPIIRDGTQLPNISKLVSQKKIVPRGIPTDISSESNEETSFMCFTVAAADQTSMEYKLLNNPERAYTDEFGIRRSKVTDDQFSINGEADYCIITRGYEDSKIGDRFLIVTSVGSYTAIIASIDSNNDTFIEFIVDKKDGSTFPQASPALDLIVDTPVEIFQGDIINLYEINSKIPKDMVFYDVPLSDDLQIFLYKKCKEGGVPMRLALAVIWKESTWRSNVISGTNDYGLMQINKSNHGWLRKELGIDDFLNSYENVTAGVHMLGNLIEIYGNNWHKVLMVYNQGGPSAQRSWNSGYYSSSYSRDIVAKMDQLKVREAD